MPEVSCNIQLTVVIPTKNGGDLFRRTLAGLQRQTCWHSVELIVVDSGSNDQTVANARKAGARVVEILPSDFNHGATRDFGISLAQTDLVVLIVQDAIPQDAMMLESIIAPFKDDMVAGVYARQIPQPDADVLTKRNLNNWLTGRLKPEVRHICSTEWYEALLPLEKYYMSNFDNVCSAIRKSVWNSYKFGKVNFGEDIDWAERVLKAGYKIAYEPSAIVMHSHDRPISYEFKRTYVCHRKLYQQFGLHLVPTKRGLIKSWLRSTGEDYRYLYEQPVSRKDKIALFFKVPILNFLGAFAQYKAVKDECAGLYRLVKGV